MDELSHLSDAELKALAGAPDSPKEPVHDIGSMSDGDLQKLAGPEPKTLTDHAVDAIPIAASALGSTAGSALGPLGTIGGGAAGYAAGNQVSKYIRDKFLGQPQKPTTAGEIGGDLALGALGGVGGAALSGLSKAVPAAAEAFATSPLPAQAGKLLSKIPLTSTLQSGANLVQGAQKGVAWALDHTPEALGKFAPVLQKAAERGGSSAVATTDFLLSQKNPEYQEIKKKIYGNQ